MPKVQAKILIEMDENNRVCMTIHDPRGKRIVFAEEDVTSRSELSAALQQTICILKDANEKGRKS